MEKKGKKWCAVLGCMGYYAEKKRHFFRFPKERNRFNYYVILICGAKLYINKYMCVCVCIFIFIKQHKYSKDVQRTSIEYLDILWMSFEHLCC